MKRRTLSISILILLSLAVAPRAAPAGDGEDPARGVLDSLSAAAAHLAELAKVEITSGRTAEARELLDLLDRVLTLKAEALETLGRVAAPPEPAPPPAAPVPTAGWFSGRGEKDRAAKWGASASADVAVGLGLAWLAAHQADDGRWDADGFMKEDKVAPIADGAGHSLYDIGVSGLALLALLGDGHTHKSGTYAETVRRGLAWIMGQQDGDGCFGAARTTNHFTYNHAVATQALCEAYALSKSSFLKGPAQKGLDFIARCQNPYLVWRYGVRPGDNDTSVTGWMVAALFAGKMAGLKVDAACFDGAKAWLDKVTEPEYGRVGYTARGTGPARPQDVMDRFPADKSEALTAAGILMRVMLGEDPRKSEVIQKGVDLCLKTLPVWDETTGAIDMYYWHWGAEAMFQVGGEAWKTWQAALKEAVLAGQRKEPVSFAGSWDAVGPWGRDGGRVYSTALCTMMLQAPYRQGRLFDSPLREGGLRRFK